MEEIPVAKKELLGPLEQEKKALISPNITILWDEGWN